MKEIYKFGDNTFYHSVWQDRSETQKYEHALIFPKNTYSPWEEDEKFKSVYEVIKDQYTLVDVFRCYELWSLASQLKTKDGDVLEVGVWRGGTGALLAKAVGDESQVYLCDTFEGVVKATTKDSIYKGGEHADTSLSLVEKFMTSLNLSNVTLLKGIFPEETAGSLEDIEFKMCHIDVDVYQSAKDIFNWVWPRLIVGGIVVFDDYGFAACEGITSLVNEIEKEEDNLIKLYNINGHAVLIKTNN